MQVQAASCNYCGRGVDQPAALTGSPEDGVTLLACKNWM